MFGSKIKIAILENLKIIAKEHVKQTELMQTQISLIAAQNHHMNQLATATKRIDEFNRKAFKAGAGIDMPEDAESEKAFKEMQEFQNSEHEALQEMYFNDISISRDAKV